MTKRFLYVYEFADKAGLNEEKNTDNLWFHTQKYLQKEFDIQIKIANGLFVNKRKNSLAPDRLFNFFYMHICAPFEILRSKADVVFVRSTPPLIQITYAFWAMLLRRKKIFWLMDYHPVFGVRTTKKGSFINFIWRVLDKIDKFFLKKFDLVVCLDEAMQELVKERAPNVETFVCPTFSLQNPKWLDLAKKGEANDPVRLLYNGNLGRAHSTENLKIFLKELVKLKSVEFCYCGESKYAKETFKNMCRECNAEFKTFGFVKDYNALGEFYKRNGFDYGVVLLNDELKGVVSPSKFSGYTSFGLPVIYLGPSGTNAHFVCQKSGAGICAENPEQIMDAAQKASLSENQKSCAEATKQTIRYFSPNVAQKLAVKLAEFCGK